MLPHEVEERVPARDLAMMMIYGNRNMLPSRRLQMQVAFLCQITASDKNRTLGEFDIVALLQKAREQAKKIDAATAEAHSAANAFSAMTGKGIIVIGRKRRERERLASGLVH